MPIKFAVPSAAVVLLLILAHGFFPSAFLIDSTTIGLIVLLVAIVLATRLTALRRHIVELNLFGSGVKFREQVEEAAEHAEAVVAKVNAANDPHPLETANPDLEPRQISWPVFVDIPEHLSALVDTDPRLAVVGLGLEAERAIRSLVRGMGFEPKNRRLNLDDSIAVLRKHHRIDAEEEGLLATLIRLRSSALAGSEIQPSDARKFFSIVESLNDFSAGYSLNLAPDLNWEDHGLMCRFEHCIERMPLKREPSPSSCGFWGHDCPGGVSQVSACASAGVFDFPGSAYKDGQLIASSH